MTTSTTFASLCGTSSDDDESERQLTVVAEWEGYGIKPTAETLKPLPPAPDDPPGAGVAVLILCAGLLNDWEGDEPKQLRKIGNETVLSRIVRQVQERGHEPIIVTWREDIEVATSGLAHYDPTYCRTIAETWLYTRELWREQTAILLGDVIHGKETIQGILNHRGTMKMVGNAAEIFAFTFLADEHDKVARVLYETDRDTQKGSPWEIYRHFCGAPYDQGFKEAQVFQWVWDRTCDIDTPSEWQGVLRIYDEVWKGS